MVKAIQPKPNLETTEMKTETFKGTIESAYGDTLPKALAFSGDYEAYESVDEVKEKNDFPNDEEIVNFVNAKRKANSRQKSMQATLDAAGVQKPTLEGNTALQIKTMVKALVASGKSEEVATQIATAALA